MLFQVGFHLRPVLIEMKMSMAQHIFHCSQDLRAKVVSKHFRDKHGLFLFEVVVPKSQILDLIAGIT